MSDVTVSIDFGPNGKARSFSNILELIDYLESIEFVGWSATLHGNPSNASIHLEKITLKLINDCLAAARTGNVEFAMTRIASLMRETPFPVGGTPLADWLIAISASEPERATYALLAALGAQPGQFDYKCAQGAIDLALFRSNLTLDSASALKVSTDRLLEEIREALEKRTSEAADLRRAFLDMMDKLESDEDEARAKRDKSHRAAVMSVHQGGTEAIKSIKDTEKAYIEFMALEAPVRYWSEKAQRHRNTLFGKKWAIGLEQLVPVYFVLMIAAASAFLFFVVRPVSYGNSADQKIGLAALGLLLSTSMLWYARILTRQLLRHRALFEDAEERSVMLKSYIALTREGHVQKEDRVLALGAAFRSASDGSHDDAAPDISTAAIIGRLVQNK